MPRVRPLRTQEEIAKVPADEPVTIAIDTDETPEVVAQTDAPAEEAPVTEDRRPKPRQEAKRENDDDEASDLRRQLDELRASAEEARRQATASEEARRKAEEERQQAIQSYSTRAEDAEYEAVLEAMKAAQVEIDHASSDLEAAVLNADAKLQAESNRKISRSETRLLQLEQAKTELEDRRSRAVAEARRRAEAPPQQSQQQPQGDQTENYIRSMANLLPSQRDWLLEHRDAVTDPRQNARLQVAHFEAEDAGYRPGSKKYFSYLESKLGYSDEDEYMEEERPRRKVPVAAPVSRDAPSPSTGRSTNTRITLTPAQREAAALAGIDEITYAKNLLKMNEMKDQGLLQ